MLYNYCPVLSINACHYVLVTKASLSRSTYLEVQHDMKEQGIHEILKTRSVHSFKMERFECEVYHFCQHMMCFLMLRLLFDNTSQNLIQNSFFFFCTKCEKDGRELLTCSSGFFLSFSNELSHRFAIITRITVIL